MALTEITSKSIKDSDIVTDDIAHGSVTADKLQVSNTGTNGQFLSKQSGDTGGLTWATASAVGGATGVAFNDDVVASWGTTDTDLQIKSDGSIGQITVSDELDINAGTTNDALKVTQTGVITNTDQFVAYSNVVVGSINAGERHYLGIAEDAANGTNTIRFYAPASLANTLTYYLDLAGGSNGDVLTLKDGADIEWATPAAGATGGGTDQIFWENGKTVNTDYTITNDKNAMSAGPIEIDSSATVTVGDGETWTIV